MMKKKALLTTLVLLSITQGSVYAEKLSSGIYDNLVDIKITDRQPAVTEVGEYTFNDGLKISSEYGSTQVNSAIISNATGSGNVITINVNGNGTKGELNLYSNSNKTPDNWQDTKNDIIRVNSSNTTNINLQNVDMILNGENFDTAVRMDEKNNTAQLNIVGDGQSNLLISGGMVGGIDAWYDAKVNIENINQFNIIKNTELNTNQIGYGNINAIRLSSNSTLDADVKDFVITGNDAGKDKVVFYSGIQNGSFISNSVFKLQAQNNFIIDSVYYGIYNVGYAEVAANNISINSIGLFNEYDDYYYSIGEAIYCDGYLKLNATNNIDLVSDVSALDFGANGVAYIESKPGKYDGIKGDAEVIAQNGYLNIVGENAVGVISLIQSKQNDIRDVLLQANGKVNIYGGDKGVFYEPGSRNMDIISKNNDISITSENIAFYAADELRKEDIGRNPKVNVEDTRGIVNIKAENGNVVLSADNTGLVVDNIAVKNKDNEQGGYFATINIEAGNDVKITGANDYGIMAQNVLSGYADVAETIDRNSYVDIDAANNIGIYGGKAGILASLTKSKEEGSQTVEVINTNLSSNVDLNAQNITIGSKEYGVLALEKGNVNIDSSITSITSEQTGVNVEDASIVTITSNNTGIMAKEDGIRTGSGGTVTVNKHSNGNGNDYLAVNSDLRALTAASNDGSYGGRISVATDKISLYGNDKVDENQYTGGAAEGQLRVQAVVFGYNSDIDLDADTINIVSQNTEKISDSDNRLYAAVQSRGASDIKITGNSTIMSENGVALYATKLKPLGSTQLPDDKQSVIKLAEKDTDGNYLSHNIMGDIVAGKDSEITIGGKGNFVGGANGANAIEVLAANGGKVDLGLQDGVLIGRVDDYYQVKDAYTDNDMGLDDTAFRNNKLYTDISTGGEITLNMNENSTWYNLGQSYVSNVNMNGGTIDLGQEKGNSVNIEKLSGTGTFNMYLNSAVIDSDEYVDSDMLYIQDVDLSNNANGNFTVNAIGKDVLTYLDYGDKLRFATVGGQNADKVNFAFNTIKDNGIKDVDFVVGHDEYDKVSEAETNEKYNGSSTSELKPGNAYVDNEFGGSTVTTFDAVTDGAKATAGAGENYYITRDKESDKVNDIGKSIINMSRANYQNAVYLDRLNKRLGEARYIDGDEGMWVRLRHDRIGMKDEFRSMNTMYQLGYDKLDNKDDKGERHIGAAIDYMDGSTSYSGIYGEGETKRWGFWMYDTWLGNKGHYADYVAKFGHMHNEFDIRSMNTGEKITGDYDNNVFSISAEYGRKKDIGNKWYFEPQAQLQLARVTDAEYKTSQNTDVYVDGINSLIGRAGFRLGKDVDERSTVYVKADVLHEFLGDQRIVAGDVTGSLDKTYENKGTWYDVGFGFATAVGHDSYAYLDFEKSFGNDNDDTYQVNVGLQWSF